MKIVGHAYIEVHKEEIIEAIKAGKIFIYPTDLTICKPQANNPSVGK